MRCSEVHAAVLAVLSLEICRVAVLSVQNLACFPAGLLQTHAGKRLDTPGLGYAGLVAEIIEITELVLGVPPGLRGFGSGSPR